MGKRTSYLRQVFNLYVFFRSWNHVVKTTSVHPCLDLSRTSYWRDFDVLLVRKMRLNNVFMTGIRRWQLEMHLDFSWCVTYIHHISFDFWMYMYVNIYDTCYIVFCVFFSRLLSPTPYKISKIILLFWHHQSIIINLELYTLYKRLWYTCLFQTTDNLCSIELHYSYAAKTNMCTSLLRVHDSNLMMTDWWCQMHDVRFFNGWGLAEKIELSKNIKNIYHKYLHVQLHSKDIYIRYVMSIHYFDYYNYTSIEVHMLF